MVKRNLTVPFEFVCFTENPLGINEEVTVKPLTLLAGVQGWWYKPLFFNPNLGLDGTILFLDLDLIVFKNIDKLFSYKPGQFLIIRDFNRHVIRNYDKFNSSVFRLTPGQHSNVYTDFVKSPVATSKRFHGDQDWIRASVKNGFEYWPDEWIQSYKWEMRDRNDLTKMPNGKRNFNHIGIPRIKNETNIAVFHGEPNPAECMDPWVVDNWQ